MPPSKLTKSFREVITVAKRLGFRYIWIDPLCIVQVDHDNWEREVSRMAAVYENARIVIAATLASTGDVGCFSMRYPFHKSVPSIPKGMPLTCM